MKLAPQRFPLVDARALGADCDNCPLKNCVPIAPPEPNKRSKLVVLGEAPGEEEVAQNAFFVGSSGRFLDRRLNSLGIARDHLHISNVLLCRPPGKLSPGGWNQAIRACLPRLHRELSGLRTRWVFGAGARALQAITGKKKITPWVGGPLHGIKHKYAKQEYGPDFSEFRIIPSFHPAFILRPKGNAYVPAFEIWLGRAWAFANGEQREWQWPKLLIDGTNEAEIRKLNNESAISVDIENLPSTGRIRCIGVGTRSIGISVPLSPERNARGPELAALRQLLDNPRVEKIFHNGSHDLLELKKSGFRVRGKIFDTLRAHAVVAPQIAHSLSVACAIEFHAPAWKSEFQIEGDDKGAKKLKKFEKAAIEDLCLYNAKDNVMQSFLAERLKKRLTKQEKGWSLYQNYADCMMVGLDMTEEGVLIDETKFERHRIYFKRKRREAARDLRAISKVAGKKNWETFKLGSSPELHDLFFKHLKVQPSRWSEETGAPKLDEKALQPLTVSHNPLVSSAARALLQLRKWHKLLRTYIDGLPIEGNRVHPKWREFGTVTGRWSSADPNLQNIPKPKTEKLKNGKTKVVAPGLRDLFRSGGDAWLLEADYSQLELRIVALLAGDPLLLEWYDKGMDIHTLNAQDLFNTESPSKDQRHLAKTFVYACNYGAKPITIWQNLVIDFPNLSLALVERLNFLWFKKHQPIKIWQNEELKKARLNGYAEAPLSGRRVHFHLGRIDASKVLNHPVQGTGADIINPSVKPIQEELRKAKIGSIKMQVHDALVVETTNPLKAAPIMRKYMEQTVTLNGYTMKFPVDFKLGRNWGHCEEVNGKFVKGFFKDLERLLHD